MRHLPAVLLTLCLGLPDLAHATEGLAWKWEEGTEHRYFITAQVMLPELLVLKEKNNKDVRVQEFTLSVNTLCRAQGWVNKQTVELRCTFDDVALAAAPTATDAGKLVELLDEMDAQYIASYAQVLVNRQGRIKNVSLEGGPGDGLRRWREIQETMRLVLVRVLAALELELPKKGDDKGREWGQNRALAMQLPSVAGSMGAVVLSHQVSGEEGDRVTIETVGRGTVGSGEMIAVQSAGGAEERPANMYDMTLTGVASFDKALGTLVERQYLVEGKPTASSIAAEGAAGIGYVQAVRLVLADDKIVPPLEENAELPPVGTRKPGYKPTSIKQ